MLAVLFMFMITAAMWSVQAVLLRRAGLPLQIRIDGRELPRRAQRVSKTAVNVIFAAALIAYPLCRGEWPTDYYGRLLPLGARSLELLHGFALPVIYLAGLYVAWIVSGQVHVRPMGRAEETFSRVALAPFMALFGATVEELLFRGLLLAGLLESLPAPAAVGIGAIMFANAHYMRRVKRYWTYPGHLALGLMLCTGFACTRTLWLPIGLHAGGIFIIMGLRPLVRYVGPPWLVGASIFPYAGVPGIVGLGLLTLNIWLHYGGGQ